MIAVCIIFYSLGRSPALQTFVFVFVLCIYIYILYLSKEAIQKNTLGLEKTRNSIKS